MPPSSPSDSSLTGQVLIAMPALDDPEFSHSVVYLCAHGEEGAMGLIINKPLPSPSFAQIIRQLNITEGDPARVINLCKGGPVESARGFVLHSTDWTGDDSLKVNDSVALTASLDVLKAIANGGGPAQGMLALGYANWGPGQLDREMKENSWLTTDADPDLLFGDNHDGKWLHALSKLNVRPWQLSSLSGSA